ncbi:hypothetical protein ABK040_007202 [Willaertia magna]
MSGNEQLKGNGAISSSFIMNRNNMNNNTGDNTSSIMIEDLEENTTNVVEGGENKKANDKQEVQQEESNDVIIEENDEDEEKDNLCIICRDEWKTHGDHKVVALPCGHIYGKSCLEKWFEKSTLCPFCRVKCKGKSDIIPIYLEASVNKIAMKKYAGIKEREKQEIRKRLRGERKKRKLFENQLVTMRQDIKKYLEALKEESINTNDNYSSNITQFLNSLTKGIDESSKYFDNFPSDKVNKNNKQNNLSSSSPPSDSISSNLDEDDDFFEIPNQNGNETSMKGKHFSFIKLFSTYHTYRFFKFMDESTICLDNKTLNSITIYSIVNGKAEEIPLGDKKNISSSIDLDTEYPNVLDLKYSSKNDFIYCSLDDRSVKILDVKSSNKIYDNLFNDIVNCISVNEDNNYTVYCGLENGEINGIDLRMTNQLTYQFKPNISPITSNANTITSLAFIPKSNSLVYTTLNSGIFEANLNNINNNNMEQEYPVNLFSNVNKIPCNYQNTMRAYNVSYDSYSSKIAFSFSSFGEKKRNIDHFIYNETSGIVNHEEPIVHVKEPEISIPSSHTFSVFEKLESTKVPMLKLNSPTLLFSVTAPSDIITIEDEESNLLDNSVEVIGGTTNDINLDRTLLAYTRYRYVSLVDAKTGEIFQQLPSNHLLPLTSIDYTHSPFGTYFGQLSPDRFTLFLYKDH